MTSPVIRTGYLRAASPAGRPGRISARNNYGRYPAGSPHWISHPGLPALNSFRLTSPAIQSDYPAASMQRPG
jgi:hypothetical protein